MIKNFLTVITLCCTLFLAACSGAQNNLAGTPPDTDITTPPPLTISEPPATAYKIFLIALEDNGKNGKKIGCDDSSVAVDGKPGEGLTSQSATQDKLQAAYAELLANKEQNYGESGLQNFLAESTLLVDSLIYDGRKAQVALSGELKLNGTCDNPRVEAQLSDIALQFPEVKELEISINGKSLQDFLSLKGE